MSTEMRLPLPLGQADFDTLRKDNCIYVDKTEMIYNLCCEGGKVFLSRPRRFGKSLLVTAFKSLFRHGTRDFKGLAIEKLWTDKTYDVVHLDFSQLKGASSQEAFAKELYDQLIEAFEPLGFHYDPNRTSFRAQFDAWFKRLDSNAFVLLIDEYDAPLAELLDNSELFTAVRQVMSAFFQVIKTNGGRIRFIFMTGVTKFRQTSIFSEFNFLDDISLNPLYGTLLGYTEEEIRKYFGYYLDRAARLLKCSEDDVMASLSEYYDGFSFDEMGETHVFCPWSVLNFFKYPQLRYRNYWYETGGKSSVLLSYIRGHALSSPESFQRPLSITLDELGAARHYNDISLNALLTQAGYLTIKSQLNPEEVELGYPNKEVELSMARLYADEMLRGVDRLETGMSRLAKMLDAEDAGTIVKHFNAVFNAIDYRRYPITNEASCRSHLQVIDYRRYPITNEASCRSHLQVLLMGGAMVPDVEKHSALGRSDLEVRTAHRLWVFELKFASQEQDAAKLLAQAAEQIKSRRYGETPHGRKLMRVALVFSAKERQFTAWVCV